MGFQNNILLSLGYLNKLVINGSKRKERAFVLYINAKSNRASGNREKMILREFMFIQVELYIWNSYLRTNTGT